MSSDRGGLPAVSVVIATRGRPALLKRCLAAVAAQELQPAEIVVVDNTEGERATRAVALGAGAHYVAEPRGGVSRARNRGAAEAGAEIVAFVDDDALPQPNWLSALLVEFRDRSVAVVTGRILSLASDDGTQSGSIFGGVERIAVDQGVPEWFERASFGGLGQGSNLAVRRSVFSTQSGFDERLGAGTRIGGAEEHHLFVSLVDRGHRVVYTPDAKILHPLPERNAEVRRRHLRDLRTASSLLTLLIVEKPHLRLRAAKFAFEALRGTNRPWHTGMPNAKQKGWQAAQMQIAGIGLYLLTLAECRLRRTRRFTTV